MKVEMKWYEEKVVVAIEMGLPLPEKQDFSGRVQHVKPEQKQLKVKAECPPAPARALLNPEPPSRVILTQEPLSRPPGMPRMGASSILQSPEPSKAQPRAQPPALASTAKTQAAPPRLLLHEALEDSCHHEAKHQPAKHVKSQVAHQHQPPKQVKSEAARQHQPPKQVEIESPEPSQQVHLQQQQPSEEGWEVETNWKVWKDLKHKAEQEVDEEIAARSKHKAEQEATARMELEQLARKRRREEFVASLMSTLRPGTAGSSSSSNTQQQRPATQRREPRHDVGPGIIVGSASNISWQQRRQGHRESRRDVGPGIIVGSASNSSWQQRRQGHRAPRRDVGPGIIVGSAQQHRRQQHRERHGDVGQQRRSRSPVPKAGRAEHSHGCAVLRADVVRRTPAPPKAPPPAHLYAQQAAEEARPDPLCVFASDGTVVADTRMPLQRRHRTDSDDTWGPQWPGRGR